MDLLPLRDLIKDEYGNYYQIIRQVIGTECRLTLVNAFVESTFRRLFHFDEDFKKDFKDYEWEFIGKYFMDMLKNRVEGLESGKYPGKIYDINEVKKIFEIEIIPFYEKSPKVK